MGMRCGDEVYGGFVERRLQGNFEWGEVVWLLET